MEINLLSFGQIADIVGKQEIKIAAIVNTDDLFKNLLELFPALESVKFVMAVNKQVIQKNTLLNQNDTVALLPPFSGG